MKRFIFLLTFVVFISSCKDADPCEDVICGSGTECIDGVCEIIDPCEDVICIGGTECINGICEFTDPCIGVLCFNDGECIEGVCECIESYEGENCTDEKTPSSVYISQIVLTDYEMTNNGVPWDPTDGPDIFLAISVNNEVQFYSDVVNNTNGAVVFPIEENFSDPELNYTIAFYETDGFEIDFGLGAIIHPLYFQGGGFPVDRDIFPIDASQLTLEYRLSGMEYSFD